MLFTFICCWVPKALPLAIHKNALPSRGLVLISCLCLYTRSSPTHLPRAVQTSVPALPPKAEMYKLQLALQFLVVVVVIGFVCLFFKPPPLQEMVVLALHPTAASLLLSTHLGGGPAEAIPSYPTPSPSQGVGQPHTLWSDSGSTSVC